jgi:hypothetical protein
MLVPLLHMFQARAKTPRPAYYTRICTTGVK